ncbi:hypothetical protein ACO22_02767 [Paracoccidioides brasiliensis]|uniref:Acid phosphatase n=1 Tax=Paracoccidioides brasiliensis TaxID=121759 RepID=A0A1D2JHW3_PARBR|nr:hypothetical protein ACO22_02767 [Paracoccidioides brasiliensis]
MAFISSSSWLYVSILLIFIVLDYSLRGAINMVINAGVLRLSSWFPFLSVLATQHSEAVDVSWYPPKSTAINNVDSLMNMTGVYGFIFNSSKTPDAQYGIYNLCNMPHVRKTEYGIPSKEYKLQYVEVMHRHHKRTVYASNSFPVESYEWHCNDEGLFHFGQPVSGHSSAQTYWDVFENPINPFRAFGFKGTCTFPQITREGLDDSWQHGHDIYGVYHDLLHFLPSQLDLEKLSFRVTSNVITSQVASMVINGMYNSEHAVPLAVESPSIDSLEPKYLCPHSRNLFSAARITPNTSWSKHLTLSAPLLAYLDSISGVSPDAQDWHQDVDHYFDNLSARLCHSKPLPCSLSDSSKCISQADADSIFRLGEFEYSYIYRDAPTSLAASAGSMGVFIAELAQHIRDQITGNDGGRIYRHNVAHDGSLSRVLSVLQVDVMVWPGMGAEVVFELYRKLETEGEGSRNAATNRGDGNCGIGSYVVRVLFGGRVLTSSSPELGVLDMVPAEKLLGYFDELVGERAAKVKGLCEERS